MVNDGSVELGCLKNVKSLILKFCLGPINYFEIKIISFSEFNFY